MPIPFLIGAAIAVAVGTAIKVFIIDDDFKEPPKWDSKDTLAVLGMRQSGKTRFLSFLSGKVYQDKNTTSEKYDSFIYKTHSGKRIKISEGVDIGGQEAYRNEYNNLIQQASKVFYFFDMSKYLTDTGYKRECNSRFSDVYNFTKNKGNIYLFATHKDKLKVSAEKASEQFRNELQGKPYAKLTEKTVLVNMIDEASVRKLVDNVFKGNR